MPARPLPASSRKAFPLPKRIRTLAKKNIADLRFAAHKPISVPTCLLILLFIPFFLTVLLCRRVLEIASNDHLRHPYLFPLPNDPYRFSAQYIDPCSLAVPLELTHFDPSTRSSGEFNNSLTTDVDPPALTRVFTTFFKIYLFQPGSDIVVNLSSTGRGRPTDVRDALIHSQRALRLFYADDSIVVRNYSLGYGHLDRVRGSRYVFLLESSNATNPRRRDVAAIQRTFDGRCFVSVKEADRQTFEKPVYMVVPYSKRPARLKWFLGQFDRLRFKDVSVRLILAVCREIPEDMLVANKLVVAMSSSRDVKVVSVPGDRTGYFSRAVAIRDGSALVPKDSIMFISDIDMYVFPLMFDSCRYNSIQNSQVYFPVFYSLYAGKQRIDKNAGYWRESSHGMSCMYKSDFDTVGSYKHAEMKFVGWGGEDVALAQAFLNDSRYEVFRAIEPALRHKWHVKHCEPMTSSYKDCVEIAFQQLGTMASVGRYLLDKKIDTQSLFSEFADEDDGGSTAIVGEQKPDSVGANGTEAMKMKRRKELLRRTQEAIKKRRAKYKHK